MKVNLREIISKILGNITVQCETYHDEEVLKNINNYKEALDEILDSLGACGMYAGDYRHSANVCGTKAKEILKDAYERISYFIEED